MTPLEVSPVSVRFADALDCAVVLKYRTEAEKGMSLDLFDRANPPLNKRNICGRTNSPAEGSGPMVETTLAPESGRVIGRLVKKFPISRHSTYTVAQRTRLRRISQVKPLHHSE